MRTHANWTFMALLVILLQAICWYMVVALVLLDISADAVVDLREHYFAHKNWFFGAMFGSIIFSAAKEVVLGGHMLGGINAGFHLIFGLGAIVAAITRQEWFHKLLSPAIVLLFFLYIALLFARL
jgi:hypothetical protein